MTPNVEPSVLQRDCASDSLTAGEMQIPEQSALAAGLTLVCIPPWIENTSHIGGEREKVKNAIYLSRKIISCSGKQHPPLHVEASRTQYLQVPYSKDRDLSLAYDNFEGVVIRGDHFYRHILSYLVLVTKAP